MNWTGALLTLAVALNTLAPQEQPAAAARARSVAVTDELKLVSEGWAFLRAGDLPRAAARAAEAAKASPRSAAAFTLGLEVEVARSTAAAGLDFYEQWLGRRTIEEPAALRRIAEAMLREEAVHREEPAARLEALRGLADDGRAREASDLRGSGPAEAGPAETRALAALGDQRAATALIAGLNSASADVRTIEALGASGSTEAIAPILDLLGDSRQEVRGAAADALGKLGTAGIAPRLAPLLVDRSVWVRAKAAGALYRLGDNTGLPILQELAADPSPASKLLAAQAMASRPDPSWMARVKELTASPDLEVRTAAAQLVAPHDPEFARSTLEPLLGHESPAIQELASEILGETATTDLTLLRRLLRSPFRLTRVRAAARVLLITR
jgi:HEAT repeat protein